MAPDTQPYCTAALNYSHGLGYSPVTVAIADGRDAELDPDTCGFRLIEHATEVTDWVDEHAVSAEHGPEIRALARELSGCDRAVPYPPIVRSPRTARETPDYAPIEFVHSDFTDDYRAMAQDPRRPYRAFIEPVLAREGLSQRDIARAERVLVLQFWRNIGPVRPDYPLAICDAATVPRSQLHSFTVPMYAGQALWFQTFGVMPPEHPDTNHWYTFPGMTRDEVLAFRTYDSLCADTGRPFWTPHSAFRDPVAGPRAPRRESVEIRALCLFGV